MTDQHEDALVEEIKSWIRDTFYDGVSNDRYSADHNQPDYEEGAAAIIALVERDVARRLLGNDHLSFCVVDEVIGRVEASGALQISPSEWQPTYDAPGAQEAVKAIFDYFIREEIGISTEEES